MHKSLEKISGSQLFSLLFLFLIGSAIILPRGPVAGHDNWIAVVLAIGLGCGLGWLYAHLATQHPGLSLIEIAEHALGVWAGKVIGLLYLVYAFHLGALVLRNVEELTLTVILSKTPPLVIEATLMLLVLWAVHEGVEVIARCAQLTIVLVFFQLVVSYLLQVHDMEIEFFLPLAENGWMPIVEATWQITTFPFGEAVLFAMILPALEPPRQAKKVVFYAMLVAGLVLLADTARNTLVFSNLTAKLQFPSFLAFAYISVIDFLERLEPVAFVVWLLAGFFKISICLHVAAVCLKQTVKVRTHRPFLPVLAILMVLVTRWLYENQAQMFAFADRVWPYYSLPFQVGIPLLVLAAVLVRKKFGKEVKKGENPDAA